MKEITVEEVLSSSLDPDPIPEEDVLERNPVAKAKVLFEGGDSSAGIWECSPGKFRWEYDQNETFALYKGKAEIQIQDGRKIKIKSGETATIPSGSSAVWNVKEKVRKAFVLH